MTLHTLIRYTLAPALLALSGCEKFEVPPPVDPGPSTFYATGLLDGEPFTMVVNGVDFEAASSWSQDSLEVYSYTGQLKDPGCDNELCGPRLEVRIRGEEDIDNGVKTGSYAYRLVSPVQQAVSSYTVTIQPEYYGSALSCEWQFNGQTFSKPASEPLVYTITSDFSKEYPVNLSVNFSGGCTSEIEDYVYLPPHGCSAGINVNMLDSLHLLYSAVAKGQPAFHYQWSFESGPTASSKDVDYFYTSVPADGVDDVLLTVEGNGCTARKKIKQVVDYGLANCNVNLSYTIDSTVSNTPPQPDLHTVEIVYVDEQGTLYESRTNDQPGWASFTILSVEDYYDPVIEREKRSKKVSVRFNVRVYSETGSSIEIKDVEMVLPVGLGL